MKNLSLNEIYLIYTGRADFYEENLYFLCFGYYNIDVNKFFCRATAERRS